jgi:uncharacterized membrane protein YidH (DUF202 family)
MSKLNDPRVLFATERTLLAWNRTSISIMAFGFVIERFGLFLQLTGREESKIFRRSSERLTLCGSNISLCSRTTIARQTDKTLVYLLQEFHILLMGGPNIPPFQNHS